MAVPKTKVSKRKIRMRVRSHRRPVVATSPCPSCGVPRLPHRVCRACGMYNGRQVLTISVDD